MPAALLRRPFPQSLYFTERYRSGHNGPDSKSGSPHGLVGSNPTRSADPGSGAARSGPFFYPFGAVNPPPCAIPAFAVYTEITVWLPGVLTAAPVPPRKHTVLPLPPFRRISQYGIPAFSPYSEYARLRRTRFYRSRIPVFSLRTPSRAQSVNKAECRPSIPLNPFRRAETKFPGVGIIPSPHFFGQNSPPCYGNTA